MIGDAGRPDARGTPSVKLPFLGWQNEQASRRARSHRAIACRNACRAGVSSRVWGCVSDGARKRMELDQSSFIGPVAIDENSLSQSYHVHHSLPPTPSKAVQSNLR